MVEVAGPAGTDLFHLDDLEPAVLGPAEALVAGQLGDSTHYALRLRSLYLKHAYRFDPHSGLSNARIEPKLHQVFIAHLVANKLQPRMILADEVGLGKTIEAGLVLKELSARGMVDRVLVVCPASLQYQWQSELRSKFNEDFEIVDGAAAKYLGRNGANPFLARDRIICSLPFAANEKRAEKIVEAEWDLVIFDEAHRVRRWRPSPSKTNTTKAYELADELKELAPGVLLLTATPMQLHPFELYSLVEIVEPGMYPSFDAYERRRKDLPALNDLMRSLKGWRTLSTHEQDRVIDKYDSWLGSALGSPPSVDLLSDDQRRDEVMDALVEHHPLAGVLVRNRKAEIGGFTRREATSYLVDLTPEELELYNDITDYIRLGYDRAQTEKQHAIGFLMVTYQKMLASSAYAIRESFRRRVKKLRKQLYDHRQAKSARAPSRKALLENYEDAAELSETLDDLDALSLDPDQLEAEIAELELLIDRLGQQSDSKVAELVRALDAIFEADSDEKVVIFTQFVETQAYLSAQVEHLGYRSVSFNGSLDLDQKEAVISEFREKAQILISTEAGGEGRNLQFSHILINYDHPWNPMKVEQRIGRLDRIGQKRPVFIHNLACRGTVEERVLSVLNDRIRLFTESVGSLDPILGEVEADIVDLIMNQRERLDEAFEDYAGDVERRVREALENDKVLADFALDRASLRKDQANALLGRKELASASDLREQIERTLDYLGGTLMPHSAGGEVINLSPRLATRLATRTGQTRGVFDHQEALEREELDFFAIGHKLIDDIVDLPTREDAPRTAARTVRGPEPGRFLEVFYEIKADRPINYGSVIRHLVDDQASVRSEVVTEMPDLGSPGGAQDVPEWVGAGIEASRVQFAEEHAAARDVVRQRIAERRDEERQRAQRVYEYRRARLQRRIDDLVDWIEKKERTGSDRDRRILPAQRGRLRKNQERLDQLNADLESQRRDIDERSPQVTGSMWAACLVEVS
jgi:SNF2 family DNA or RNA helicase